MAITFATVRHVHRTAPGASLCPCSSGEVKGLLISGPPQVGQPLRIVRDRDGRLLTTTTIVRVLGVGKQLFVQTENSVYRVDLREVELTSAIELTQRASSSP